MYRLGGALSSGGTRDPNTESSILTHLADQCRFDIDSRVWHIWDATLLSPVITKLPFYAALTLPRRLIHLSHLILYTLSGL